jgi:phosphoribosyl 1,2-cyclic phosphate phosphodiesterase
MSISLEFLGTGTSGGVPIIGCTCAVCTSPDPHDSRLRSSVLIHTQGKHLLVDTSPDLRQQMLRANPPRIDAVVYTHMHSDHTAGLDDLRPFNFRQEDRRICRQTPWPISNVVSATRWSQFATDMAPYRTSMRI